MKSCSNVPSGKKIQHPPVGKAIEKSLSL